MSNISPEKNNKPQPTSPDANINPDIIRQLQQNMAVSAVDFLSSTSYESLGSAEKMYIRSEVNRNLIALTQLTDLGPNITNFDWQTIQWPMENAISTARSVGHSVDRTRMLLRPPEDKETTWVGNKIFLNKYGEEADRAAAAIDIERISRSYAFNYFDSMLNMNPAGRGAGELGMENLSTFYDLATPYSEDADKLAKDNESKTIEISKDMLLGDEKGNNVNKMSNVIRY